MLNIYQHIIISSLHWQWEDLQERFPRGDAFCVFQNKNLEKERKNLPANKKLSMQNTRGMGGVCALFSRNYEELSVAGMGDVAGEGRFKKAEKVAAPRGVLRLSQIGVFALGHDCRPIRGPCSLLLQCPTYQTR